MEKTYTYYNFYWIADMPALVEEKAKRLLGDYYYESPENTAQAKFRVVLKQSQFKDLNELLEFGRPLVIHNSKKTTVHETGISYDNGLIRKVYNLTTKTVYLLNYLTREIIIYNTDVQMLSRDYIRVIRDIVKAEMEGQRNSCLLHASALESPNGAGIILIGSKGGGKTTLSLNLIKKFGYHEISRDRSFIVFNKEKENEIWGWPNYYNLTPRSIVEFMAGTSEAEKYADLSLSELDALSEKKQFTASEMRITKRKNATKLTKVFVLNNENQGKIPLGNVIAENVYSPVDLNYPNWHHWENVAGKCDEEKIIQRIRELLISPNTHYISWENSLVATKEIVKITEAR